MIDKCTREVVIDTFFYPINLNTLKTTATTTALCRNNGKVKLNFKGLAYGTYRVSYSGPINGISAPIYLLQNNSTTWFQNDSFVVNNLPAGSYTFKVEPNTTFGYCSNVCYEEFTVVVPDYAQPKVKLLGYAPVCATGGGIIAATASNGNAPYTYELALQGTNDFTQIIGSYTGSPQASGIFTGLPANTYDVRVVDQCGNSSISSTTVSPLLTAPGILDNGPVCAGNTLTVETDTLVGATYVWTFNGAPLPYTRYKFEIPNATLANAGNYEVTITIAGCGSISSGTYAVSVTPPTVTATVNGGTYCYGTPITLTGNHTGAGSSHLWESLSGPQDLNFAPNSPYTDTANVSIPPIGNYIVRYSYSDATCTANDTALLTIIPIPNTVNAGPDQTLCNATGFTLDADTVTSVPDTTFGTSNLQGTWTAAPSNPNSVTITDIHDPKTTITGVPAPTACNEVYKFIWTPSNGNCTPAPGKLNDTLTITNYKPYTLPADKPNAGADLVVCTTPQTITPTLASCKTGLGWLKLSGGTIQTTTNTNTGALTITGGTEGNYSFELTVYNGPCATVKDTINITYINAKAGLDIRTCVSPLPATTSMNASVPEFQARWTQLTGPATATVTTAIGDSTSLVHQTSISYPAAGVYTFEYETSSDAIPTWCSKDTVKVYVSIPATPNAGADRTINCQDTVHLHALGLQAGYRGTWRLKRSPAGSGSLTFTSLSSPASIPATYDSIVSVGTLAQSGDYVFTWSVVDTARACAEVIDSVKITVTAPKPQAIVSVIPVSCANVCDGQLVVHAIGGAGTPYEYSLNGTSWQLDSTFTGLCKISDTVYFRSQANTSCINTLVYTIQGPSAITAANVTIGNIRCNAQATGAITIQATGGVPNTPSVIAYKYSLSGTDYLGNSIFIDSNYTGSFTGLKAGTYSVTATDKNACMDTIAQVVLTQGPKTSFNLSDITVCSGDVIDSILIKPTYSPDSILANNASATWVNTGVVDWCCDLVNYTHQAQTFEVLQALYLDTVQFITSSGSSLSNVNVYLQQKVNGVFVNLDVKTYSTITQNTIVTLNYNNRYLEVDTYRIAVSGTGTLLKHNNPGVVANAFIRSSYNVNDGSGLQCALNGNTCVGWFVDKFLTKITASTYIQPVPSFIHTLTWSNSQPTIGLSANGIGDAIPSFILSGGAPLVAEIIVKDSLNGCPAWSDTFNIIRKICVTKDTVYDTTHVQDSIILCVLVESFTNADSIQIGCTNALGGTFTVVNDSCIKYVAPINTIGNDTTCIIICDTALNICDTTTVIITVLPKRDTVYDTLQIEDSITVCKTIEAGLNPDVVTTCGGTVLGTVTVNNGTLCVTYKANITVGNDTTCIIVTDTTKGISDTTTVIITVLPKRDTILDTVTVTDSITVCKTIESGLNPDVVTTCGGTTLGTVTLNNGTLCVTYKANTTVGNDTTCIIVTDTTKGISDTTTVIITVLPKRDTVYDTVHVTDSITVCKTIEAGLNPDVVTTCGGTVLGTVTLNNGTLCVTYKANTTVGNDTTCIIVTDTTKGISDTTTVIVTVVPKRDTVYDTLYIQDSITVCKTIEAGLNPDLVTTCGGTVLGTVTINNGTLCVTYKANTTVGNDTTCIIVTDTTKGISDTTTVIITVLPKRDTVYDTVTITDSITVCKVIESGLNPDVVTTCGGTVLGTVSINNGTLCVTYKANTTVGNDTTCTIVTDTTKGISDTTTVIITVLPKRDTVYDTLYIQDSITVCKTIESGLNPDVVSTCGNNMNLGTVTVNNGTLCVTYKANTIIGNDTTCIIVTDTTKGISDTTTVIITILPKPASPDTIYDTLYVQDSILSICKTLETDFTIDSVFNGCGTGVLGTFSHNGNTICFNYASGLVVGNDTVCIVAIDSQTNRYDTTTVIITVLPRKDTIYDTTRTNTLNPLCTTAPNGLNIHTISLCKATILNGSLTTVANTACTIWNSGNRVGTDTSCIIVCDTVKGICDTTVVILTVYPRPDSLYDTIRIDSTSTFCVSLEPGFNPQTATISVCDPVATAFGNTLVTINGTCVLYSSVNNKVGDDRSCIIVCDTALGMCDTTYIFVRVIPNRDTLPDTITIGDSTTLCFAIPNGFGNNITSTLCSSTSYQGNTVSLTTNNCIQFNSTNNRVGRDTACFVVCDNTLNICDTNVIIITILPKRDTILDTIRTGDSVTICKVIEAGLNPDVISSCGNNTNLGTVTVNNGTLCIKYQAGTTVGTDTTCIIVCDTNLNMCDTTTVIIKIEEVCSPQIGLAKAIIQRDSIAPGHYQLTYELIAENLGENALNQVQIIDNLTAAFPSPISFSIVAGSIQGSPSNTVQLNPNYTGTSAGSTQLLLSPSSSLAIGDKDTLRFTVDVTLNGRVGRFENSAYISAISDRNCGHVYDNSTNGNLTDKNGNGLANDSNESEPTPFIVPS
jgi:hypothetical protein